jgi:hypothetical protein
MDYIQIKQLQKRGELAATFNMAMELISDIRSHLDDYEQHVNDSLEETEGSHVVSEANMNAALEGLRTAHHTLATYKHS